MINKFDQWRHSGDTDDTLLAMKRTPSVQTMAEGKSKVNQVFIMPKTH